ncbi:MAG: nitrogenase cofactor biosynthesis protein NifB [Campylobacterales bacterium]
MSCSSHADLSGLQAEIAEKINNHPCYSEGAHHHYARIHLPVAPACNIQCHYCNRKYDCSNESRPGVTSSRLTPEGGLKKVLHVGGQIKQLSVVGIAGPGDALANPEKTFETFRLLREHAPDLKLCVSTNGLRLPEFVDDLIAHGVDHVTVTINAVDPKVGAQIYPWVYDTHTKKRYTGVEGAALLLSRQLEGIKKAADRGLLIKANSVLIPGVNEDHLPLVAAKLKELGVFLHNIMPLLSEPEFGTHYALNGVPSATAAQVKKAQAACGIDVKQMAHCHQCRADAVGLLGEDKSAEFAPMDFLSQPIEALVENYDREGRAQLQETIETFRRHAAKADEAKKALSSNGKTILIAVTSSTGETIDWHFGSCDRFDVYEAGDLGAKLFTKKAVAAYCSGEINCGTGPIDAIKAALKGVKLLLTAKIGDCPQKELGMIKLKTSEAYADRPVMGAVVEAAQAYFGNGKKQAEA